MEAVETDLEKLTHWWIAERTAPELLPFQSTLIENLYFH
jgi:hypothetical protein